MPLAAMVSRSILSAVIVSGRGMADVGREFVPNAPGILAYEVLVPPTRADNLASDNDAALLRDMLATGIEGGGTAGGGRRRAPPPAAPTPDIASILEHVTTTPCECAEDVARAPGAPCASPAMLQSIIDFVVAIGAPLEASPSATKASTKTPGGTAGDPAADPAADPALLPTAATPEAAAVRAAAAALGCASESCVLAHPRFQRLAGLPPGAARAELEARFKAAGPRDTLALTSNFNLDGTLCRWARVYPEFFPCPFAMMDFDRNGDLFGTVRLPEVLEGRVSVDLGPPLGRVTRPATVFGCVVNTDTSHGDGKHWTAVFVDCRAPDGEPWTVEYFNSAGNPPPRAMAAWMERTRADLAEWRAGRGPVEAVPVTDVDHQESMTECGLYALYYIRRRLEGAPYTDFCEAPIPDAAMTAFRPHVFRAS